MISALASTADLAAELGKNVRLARVAQGLRQEDLAQQSQASVQAIKNLEGGGNVELLTFLRVARALGMADKLMASCQPAPRTLDELERMEAARTDNTRVRVRA